MFTFSDIKNINNIAGLSVTPNFNSELISLSQIPELYHTNQDLRLLQFSYNYSVEHPYFAFSQLSTNGNIYFQSLQPEFEAYNNVRVPHHHDFFELLYVVEGEVYQQIENKRHRYQKGSCCLMNQNVYHTEENTGNQRIIFLQFTSNFITQVLLVARLDKCISPVVIKKIQSFFSTNQCTQMDFEKEYVDFIPLKNETWIEKNIHFIFDALTHEFLNPSLGSTPFIQGYFLNLLQLLFSEENFTNNPVHIGSSVEQHIFEQITNIMKASDGMISRNGLEKEMNYSGDYLYKITRKYTGLSLSDYAISFRIQKSMKLLRTTTLNIKDVALMAGFTNQTQFYKAFFSVNQCTPKEYRQRKKENSITNFI